MDKNAVYLLLSMHMVHLILLTGDPFFDPLFMLTENTVDKVIIRAINCNGQRAKVQTMSSTINSTIVTPTNSYYTLSFIIKAG